MFHEEDLLCAKPPSADGLTGIKRFGVREAWLRLVILVLCSQLYDADAFSVLLLLQEKHEARKASLPCCPED